MGQVKIQTEYLSNQHLDERYLRNLRIYATKDENYWKRFELERPRNTTVINQLLDEIRLLKRELKNATRDAEILAERLNREKG